MPEPVLDTVSLRVMAFAHPHGVDLLLGALGEPRARFPAEIYSQDATALPLDADDVMLSELARGLRFARKQVATLPVHESSRYATWLTNATQIDQHLRRASLVLDPLAAHELPLREQYRANYGIGRGEAACLVLAQRHGAAVVFLSSDAVACQAATDLALPYLTLPDVLTAWVDRLGPTIAEIDALVTGMRAARFGLTQEFIEALKQRSR